MQNSNKELFATARGKVESELHANRADRRPEVNSDACCWPQIRQAEITGIREDVPRIEKRHRSEPLDGVDPKLRIQHDFAVAAFRKPGLWIDGSCRAKPVEREPADGSVASGEEAFARGQVL